MQYAIRKIKNIAFLYLHEMHDKATGTKRKYNSPTKNEMKKIKNIKITNLRQEN